MTESIVKLHTVLFPLCHVHVPSMMIVLLKLAGGFNGFMKQKIHLVWPNSTNEGVLAITLMMTT